MTSILNTDCSMFANVKDTIPVTVNLLDWIKNDQYAYLQARIREAESKNEKDQLKQQLPCITPSGLFEKRSKYHLIKHTGLISVDIDGPPNECQANFRHMKDWVSHIPNVAYCGLSVSGKGFWLLIPIKYPDKHEAYFRFLKAYFKGKWGILIDAACKDITRLRIYSYDPDAYICHDARPLEAFLEPKVEISSNFLTNPNTGKKMPIWLQYNASNHFINILLIHGWKINTKKGSKTLFTRPGKVEGISAEFDRNMGVFYVFTSSTQFESNKGYSPFQVYSILEHGGDYRKAAEAMYKLKLNGLIM